MISIPRFKKTILEYYEKHGRHDLPWRKTQNPYYILVSEIMLQQTQAPRVIPKYISFLQKFPTTHALATASLTEVLTEWQGLGYNRRARYLKLCAETIESEHGGKFPKDFKTLCTLPGIGPATAGDILAFAYNIPVPLIETNVRSVFIHFFFSHENKVSDTEVLHLVEKTLDLENPHRWYSALFDYGNFLKQTGNPNTKSKHYTKQSTFKGSNREKRSTILRLILEKSHTEKELFTETGYDPEKIAEVLSALMSEKMITKKGSRFCIA